MNKIDKIVNEVVKNFVVQSKQKTNETIVDKPLKLHELDLMRKLGNVTFDNPLSLYLSGIATNKITINEGLIRTYPIDKTIEYVKKSFPLLGDDGIYKVPNEQNGGYNIMTVIPNIGQNIENINKAMNFCGYHFSATVNRKHLNNVEYVFNQYEAKNTENSTDYIRKHERYLFHLTPSYNKEKIIKNGFSPKCKNEFLKFPSRVYFIRASKVTKNDIVEFAKILDEHNHSKGNNHIYTVFMVDLNKIPKDVKFSIDNNYIHGVMTSDNITPESIVQSGTINLKENKNNINWQALK